MASIEFLSNLICFERKIWDELRWNKNSTQSLSTQYEFTIKIHCIPIALLVSFSYQEQCVPRNHMDQLTAFFIPNTKSKHSVGINASSILLGCFQSTYFWIILVKFNFSTSLIRLQIYYSFESFSMCYYGEWIYFSTYFFIYCSLGENISVLMVSMKFHGFCFYPWLNIWCRSFHFNL